MGHSSGGHAHRRHERIRGGEGGAERHRDWEDLAEARCAFFEPCACEHCSVRRAAAIAMLTKIAPLWQHAASPVINVAGHAVPTSVVYPLTAAGLYILMICFRKRIHISLPSWFIMFHNAAMITLAVIVLIGTLLGALERSQDPQFGGVAGLFCPPKGLSSSQLWTGTLGLFVYVFYLSKYVELIDTFILICQGKELKFLHCYHHCSMLFVTWSWFAFPWLEGAWWCAVVNSIIHSFMYYYYLCTFMKFKIWWGKYLTSAQIFQVPRPPAPTLPSASY